MEMFKESKAVALNKIFFRKSAFFQSITAKFELQAVLYVFIVLAGEETCSPPATPFIRLCLH